MTPTTSPIPGNEPIASPRLISLDMLRGVALLGILLMNIYTFANLYPYLAPISPAPSDFGLSLLSTSLFEGRFISLFAMLFGIGILLQAQRFGHGAYPKLKGRMKALFVIGLVHGFILWPGDILASYALSAWVVWHYRDLSPLQKWQKGWLLFHLSMIVLLLLAISPEPLPARNSSEYLLIAQQWSGSPAQQLTVNVEFMLIYLISLPLSTLWLTSGLMLIGQSLFAQGYFAQGASKQQLRQYLILAALLSGLAIMLDHSGRLRFEALSAIFTYYAAIPTALIFSHIVICWLSPNSRLGRSLANVGRLSLSLYLLQSLIGTLLFRHWFTDWQLSFTRLDYLALAMVIILLQICLANLYLKRFAIGPFEYLWRALSRKLSSQA
ncbi:DUF418 domain-containing protein [Shewanella sp. NIFS-20-20]|uniref:DUF418 domain-containing protein n=1 Tax=Shewanella sp. NIFS-20-20 TaxID=2853806 RepID=UPI001C4930CD|nr:DUF418 domain-containing protein [Shewanella sp. NIFS-20-20]MBV7314501.1 DUF418 domain-containing protein [Shewanella sp. NIFS-20-20]